MDGIKRREAAIRSVTKSLPGGQVTYVDIKKFYDSISPEVATQSWQRFCDRNIIATPVPELGLKIIQNHAQETAGKSILTGPMFSHFVANLVLHDIDKIAEDLPSYYVRYVDDITLIGSEESNDASLTAIRSLLGKIDLALHDDKEKTFSLNCAEWESAASHIVANKHEGSWKKLVGNIKKCMIFFPDQVEALTHKLSEAGYRLPLSDYSLAVTETNSFQKIRSIGLWQWLLFRTESNVVQLILDSASVLADDYETDVFEILAEINQASTFLRKRLVSQIRYRLGRLMYLSSLSVLERLRVASIGVPELMFHTSIIEALVTRDCSKVVSLGVKVAQATAQLFRAAGMLAEFSEPVSTEAQIQGLATFIANGVQIGEAIFDAQHPILKIAIDGVDKDMLSREDSFIHELACLHGIGAPRHAATLNSAFDLADKISLDALDFDDGYYL
ncbi:RNA-directed DNA polymerase [Glacieibacterium sp.]|uniref:RNA-directed DNA polymerase n=1 Tax=Glacieibacterium sp. TaxID=2860237 RepID=UPI003B006918